jgi:alkanesulfonate monooxygenase SsuD/methylene tetrahydromethanopterin reductase-like flavin-dependent oxidoreductase (luciferase family)
VRERNKGRLISGTPIEVAMQLRDLANAYDTDEVMINLMMPNEEARLNALDTLSTALEISAPSSTI